MSTYSRIKTKDCIVSFFSQAATPKARHTLFAISLWLFCNPWWFESNLDDPEKLPSIVAALVFHIFVLALALVIIHKNVKDGNPDLDATRYLVSYNLL